MKDNQHTQAIPSTVLTQVQTKIDEAKTLLAPYLLALTPTERHELPKMGEKTIAFVEKAYDFARQNPALVQPYLEVAAAGRKEEPPGCKARIVLSGTGSPKSPSGSTRSGTRSIKRQTGSILSRAGSTKRRTIGSQSPGCSAPRVTGSVKSSGDLVPDRTGSIQQGTTGVLNRTGSARKGIIGAQGRIAGVQSPEAK